MKKLILLSAVAAAFAAPTAAQAQAVPAAVVAIVDLEKITADCTACKAANTALQSQVAAYKARQQQLAAPLETEGKALETAVAALNGKEPDAALKTRIQTFQTRRTQAAQELARQEQQIQRNQAYIQQQIGAKLGPIYQQVMQRRGANIMVETGTTLAASSRVDVTSDVLAALNAALPSVATTAPAAPQQQQQPQGR